MERHLRLVSSCAVENKQRTSLIKRLENIANSIKTVFISKKRKRFKKNVIKWYFQTSYQK